MEKKSARLRNMYDQYNAVTMLTELLLMSLRLKSVFIELHFTKFYLGVSVKKLAKHQVTLGGEAVG